MTKILCSALLLLAACGSATEPRVIPVARVVTFGDSNTDLGYIGDSAAEASYISPNFFSAHIISPRSPHSLAGKLEAFSDDTLRIAAVNHGVAGTTSGAEFRADGHPHALASWQGVTRFEAEVLGVGAPGWDAGTGKPRSFAYRPSAKDFAYVSIGTNDIGFLIDSASTAQNLARMVGMWKSAGLPASHLMITTLPPHALYPAHIPKLNAMIRALALAAGLTLIDIARITAEGEEWRAGLSRDGIHYTEAVRDQIAVQVAAQIRALSKVQQPARH